MNYYQARELEKDGKPSGIWHYTCKNDNRIWPVGYCAEGCTGHSKSEEAEEHYRQWQIDNAAFDHVMSNQQKPCQVCKAWTQGFATIGNDERPYILCDTHRNREELEKIVKSPGVMIASW